MPKTISFIKNQEVKIKEESIYGDSTHDSELILHFLILNV